MIVHERRVPNSFSPIIAIKVYIDEADFCLEKGGEARGKVKS